MGKLTDEQLSVIRFCSIECEMQRSGERSVHRMVEGWQYAFSFPHRRPSVDNVLTLGAIVEPSLNIGGFRQVGVRVGWDVKGDWQDVPRQIAQLCGADAIEALTPAEWFRQYEEIHPFRDGNGRTGQLLFNWLNGTLGRPEWAPNFWHDARRTPGYGEGVAI